MKKMFSVIVLSFAAGLFVACGDSGESSKIPLLHDLESFYSLKTGGDMTPYYTDSTIAAARRYSSTHNGTDILFGMDRKIFAKGARMHAVEEKRNGDRAEVLIQIDKHPAVNMIGLRVRIPLSFEDGRWKIDRSKMIPE
jgi:hypothetical protein